MNKKPSVPPTGQAARYEQAWNYVVGKLPQWKRDIVVEYRDTDPNWDRISNEVTKEIIKLGQCEGWNPPDDNAPF